MEAGAELQQIADRQPDERRQGRNHLEIDDRPQSDHTDPAHVAHLGNANGDCREDDQWHDRPDEHDKAIADRLYVDSKLRKDGAEQDTDTDGDQHLHVAYAAATGGLPPPGCGN
jgi:hypothetical protein